MFINGRDIEAHEASPKTIIVETIVETEKEELDELLEDLEEKEVVEEVYFIKKDDASGESKFTTKTITIMDGEKI
ncbi:MAG: hypothetical protein AAGC45_02155, partial [Bacteroidota bacterium]